MKRILLVAPFAPPVHGSSMVSGQIKDILCEESGFRVDSVNLSTSRDISEIRKFKFVKIFRFFYSYFKCLYLLVVTKYDICYCAITCHGIPFLKDAPFVLLFKLFGRNVLLHQHNKGMLDDIDKFPYQKILPFVYKNCKVILLSWFLYPDICRIVQKENVLICPNGVAIPSGTSSEKIKNDIPHILFLSNLMLEKGVLVLLDALKMLKDRDVAFICEFAGGQSKEIDIVRFDEEVEARGLDRIVSYSGPVYGKDKDRLFDSSDIFVLPTFNECFPLVILEAMSHCLPVVSTPVGGVPDEVEDGKTGFLVRPGDASCLAEALLKLIVDDSMRHLMGENGRRSFEQRYTDSIFKDRILSIFMGAMNS